MCHRGELPYATTSHQPPPLCLNYSAFCLVTLRALSMLLSKSQFLSFFPGSLSWLLKIIPSLYCIVFFLLSIIPIGYLLACLIFPNVLSPQKRILTLVTLFSFTSQKNSSQEFSLLDTNSSHPVLS